VGNKGDSKDMRVAIVGPRDLQVTDADIHLAIEKSGFDVTYILTGDAKGVDSCAWRYANKHFPGAAKKFHAQWNSRGKSAGPYRNWFMVNRGGAANGMIAFVRKDLPCTSGTASSIAEATIKGIPIHIVKV
jgi:hypothetical protein